MADTHARPGCPHVGKDHRRPNLAGEAVQVAVVPCWPNFSEDTGSDVISVVLRVPAQPEPISIEVSQVVNLPPRTTQSFSRVEGLSDHAPRGPGHHVCCQRAVTEVCRQPAHGASLRLLIQMAARLSTLRLLAQFQP
eukprot:764886-Hanusia_phi.AAC.4